MAVQIRPAVFSDIGAIREIARITWHHTYENLIPEPVRQQFLSVAYSDEMLKQRIGESIFLVAVAREKATGFIQVTEKGRMAVIDAIYVLPEFQGKGMGTRLFQSAFGKLKQAKAWLVDVESGNETGFCFYQAKGFRVVKVYTEPFFGHDLRTVRMKKDILI